VTDSDIKVRRKTAFLLNNLLNPASSASGEPTPSGVHAPLVHANSHASMLSDPESASTSEATCRAMRDNGVLEVVIRSLVNPVPFGADGDTTNDVDFEEKIVQYVDFRIF
jgi:hsp70-interacting protein